MKRTRIRKKGKSESAKIQQKLWELCRQIIRKRYPNICYTCDATGLKGANWHTGHMWAKGSLHALLKYDLRILRPQCYRCNMILGGMGAIFYEKMLKEEGKKYMQALDQARWEDKNVVLKSTDHYLNLIESYTQILKELNERTNKKL